MNVSAIIVTYGGRDLGPVLESLPLEWERIVWNNGKGQVWIMPGGERTLPASTLLQPGLTPSWLGAITPGTVAHAQLPDLAVYGRYAALDYASHELIYVQDDDVIVSDPEQIVATMNGLRMESHDGPLVDAVVCNMPEIFRHSFYEEHALSGFGAAFPRSLPGRTFVWFKDRAQLPEDAFNRTCDIIFTGLTQRVLVDIPIESLPYAHDESRMWRQPDHVSERTRTLQIVKALASLDPVRQTP